MQRENSEEKKGSLETLEKICNQFQMEMIRADYKAEKHTNDINDSTCPVNCN